MRVNSSFPCLPVCSLFFWRPPHVDEGDDRAAAQLTDAAVHAGHVRGGKVLEVVSGNKSAI
jgi:hypothetical protein